MANKVVQLVDKNSNNLYPIAGSVITDAVSTTAISNQAVTNPKIENGAVNGVANDATAIGTAKLALDTVGTPNLRDASVTSDKIDWTTIKLGRVLYKNYTIDKGVTNWNNNRIINIPLSALAPIGISQGDVAKVEFSGRFNNDTYRTIFGITVSNSLSALSDMGYHVEQQDQDNIVSAGFSALSTVDSSGITVELTANDYTRSDSLGTIIVQKLLSATDIS